MTKLRAFVWGLVAAATAIVLALLGRRRDPTKVVSDAERRDTPKLAQSEEFRAELERDKAEAEALRHEPTTGAMTESEAKKKLGDWIKK